ncbi:MAG: HlyD family efflux transporter periplasmic adaptor subunit [Bacteroidia bacterium]
MSGLLVLAACNRTENRADAYGNFEAREVIVSAEGNGRLLSFDVVEGRKLAQGAVVGCIDTMQLSLQKQQLRSRIRAVLARRQDLDAQIRVFEEQKKNLLREQARVQRLLADSAATQKQLDDIGGQLELVDRQMNAQITGIQTANRSVSSEVQPLLDQIAIIDDQIWRSVIRNPLAGQTLVSYAEPGEITAFGRPLYKLADTDTLLLRAYISGSQLAAVKLGQAVQVRIDQGIEDFRSYTGTVRWIAEEAEFTPKIIQTKEARVNMVYAMKVAVPNDGSLKIGMPGEVLLTPAE